MLGFDIVIQGLKLGKYFSRVGWNEKDKYIGMQNTVKLADMTMVMSHLYVCVPGTSESDVKLKITPWIPSQSDLISEDWCEVEAEGSRAIAN